MTPDCWGYECEIVLCLMGKGLEFCYQCNQYAEGSCERFEKLATGYLEDGVDLRANLERIRRGEIEEWLRESREKYKCPVCGEPFCKCGEKKMLSLRGRSLQIRLIIK